MAEVIDGEFLTPVIRKPGQSITLSFPDALKEVMGGKRIRRLSWEVQADYGLLKDGWLTIYTKGGFHSWLVNDGDLEGNDWVVVGDVN